MKARNLLLAVLLMAGPALGAYVELTTVADTDIRQGAPDYAKGNRTYHYICNTSGNSGKAYIKFELPADFGTATSVTLNLHCGAVHPSSYGGEMNVHGLLDGAVGNDWRDLSPGSIPGQPYSDGLTWNNAPANDTSSGYQFTSDATGVLGTFMMTGGRYGGYVGEEYNVSTPDLLNFINTDTDDQVTFMIGRVGVSSAWHGIAAREMGSQPGPILKLTYEPVPEPVTMMLLGLGGVLTLRRRRG